MIGPDDLYKAEPTLKRLAADIRLRGFIRYAEDRVLLYRLLDLVERDGERELIIYLALDLAFAYCADLDGGTKVFAKRGEHYRDLILGILRANRSRPWRPI